MTFRQPLFTGNFDGRGWSNVNTSFGGHTIYVNTAIGPAPEAETERLVGSWKHVEASTDTDLAISPPVIWDANRYYRSLGFAWPFRGITVKQLRLAYMDRDGQSSEFLTYVLKMLRNPEIRRAYDLTPFGRQFLDRYVQDMLKRQAIEAARKFNEMRGFGPERTAQDVLNEWGFGVDPEGSSEQPDVPKVSVPDATVKTPWMYSYYLWRSDCDDTERLARWQELLRAEFVRSGMKLRFAVGFMGRNARRWVTGEVEGRLVVYLHEDVDPTEEMAVAAVAAHERS